MLLLSITTIFAVIKGINIYKLKNGGYSILEVLMTIVVVGILFSAVIALYSNVLIVQHRTQNLETATRAAHRQVEALRNLQYNSLEEGEDIDFSDDLPADLPAGSSGIVEVTEAQQGLKRVDVTVTYPDGSSDNEVTVSSLIGIIGITQ
jgi:prepilin-type N-terminal cleavage/methylation domain-containing protein